MSRSKNEREVFMWVNITSIRNLDICRRRDRRQITHIQANLELWVNLTWTSWTVGGSRSTQREPMQTQSAGGLKLWTFFFLRWWWKPLNPHAILNYALKHPQQPLLQLFPVLSGMFFSSVHFLCTVASPFVTLFPVQTNQIPPGLHTGYRKLHATMSV